MLAIQNQVSVLTKILETKIQQQQIVEYQKAVAVSLHNKVTSPIQTRSRKISSNQDGNFISNIKDKKITSTNSNNSCERVNEVSSNVSNDNAVRDVIEKQFVSQTPGCIIS